ncbi:putative mediator of RNA polymerase II transcription subunit 17 isoform X1 [Onthophagus taurus]|uniref:putative mediator of RNA polymerase II transcription subunit 17 isoform X1 n=1 Tax=Onthophagus taurus TaxID=166361 RepID=UPI000C20D520|nr:glycine-rich RNA-binding protein GRP1A-like [Onthophagus taurus]
MRQLTCAFGLVLLVTLWQSAESRSLVKRQLEHGHAAIEPGHGDHHDDAFRDKKKVEAKWGFKNALIGLVFNKINQFIDQKTQWVNQLDHANIAKNKAQGIYPPKDPVISLSGLITDVVGQKLQAAGPFLGVAIQKITSGSGGLLGGASGGHGGGGGHGGAGVSAGFNLGGLLGGIGGGAGGHAGGGAVGYHKK